MLAALFFWRHVAWGKSPPPQIRGFPSLFHRGRGSTDPDELAATDFIGSLKGKTMVDLVKAIDEGRAFVTVHTKKFPKGEICGKIEDP